MAYEGGIRVTSFVTGGFLPPAQRGTNSSILLHISDWYRHLPQVIVKTMLISTCIRLTLVSRLPSLRLFLQRLAMTGIYHAFCDS